MECDNAWLRWQLTGRLSAARSPCAALVVSSFGKSAPATQLDFAAAGAVCAIDVHQPPERKAIVRVAP